jgi:hypothetical protein
MKNTIKILGLMLLISAFQLNAQETKNGAKFGIKGGLNFSNLYEDEVTDNNVLVGYQLGVFLKLPIVSFFSIQPEVLYTTKGAELTYDNAFATGTAKFTLNYIEVPVLAVINLTDHINIHAGPYFAFLVDQKVKNQSNVTAFDFENTLNKDNFNSFDTGIALGVAVDVESFSFGARYNYGLQKIGKERSFLGTNYTYPNGKNSVINIFVALSLN